MCSVHLEYNGGFSAHWGYIVSTSEGYHEHIGDIVSTLEGYHEYKGDIQYIGEEYHNLRGDLMSSYAKGCFSTPSPNVLMTSLRCTHDIPHPPHES